MPIEKVIWVERFILIEANSVDDARIKAEALKTNEPVRYQNSVGEMVEWEMVRVAQIREVENLQDGAELFFRFLRSPDVESLNTPFED